MSIRAWIDNHKGIALLVPLLVVAAAVGIYLYLSKPNAPSLPTKAYFYDLEAKHLFTADRAKVAPIANPAGKEGVGVRAYVFSCGRCENESERFVGYLETFSAEGKAGMTQTQNPAAGGSATGVGYGQSPAFSARKAAMSGRQIASEKSPEEWSLADSPEATQVMDEVGKACGGAAPKLCEPPDR
jgi:hypothetical protein